MAHSFYKYPLSFKQVTSCSMHSIVTTFRGADIKVEVAKFCAAVDTLIDQDDLNQKMSLSLPKLFMLTYPFKKHWLGNFSNMGDNKEISLSFFGWFVSGSYLFLHIIVAAELVMYMAVFSRYRVATETVQYLHGFLWNFLAPINDQQITFLETHFCKS